MKPALTIGKQPWMTDSALAAVMDALEEGKALIVGGAVRSAILNEKLGDIDIATQHAPDIATQRLEAAGIKVVPTGLAHGTVTAVVDRRGFEITSLRRDVETDGRRAVVAFTTDWLEDAQRRDFTMNTLLMNRTGQIFDPTGQGLNDLKNGRVRFVGDPKTRILEDALRILRFFRFHAWYGKGDPDTNGLVACMQQKAHIENLSRERITHEIEKLLPAQGAGATVAAMVDAEILNQLFQKNFNQRLYEILQKAVLNPKNRLNPLLLFVYAVWENNVEVLDIKIEKYLVLSNTKKSYLKNCIQFINDHSDSLRQNIYRFGQDITLSGVILSHLFKDQDVNVKSVEKLVEEIAKISVPVLPIGAKDVMDTLNLTEGKKLGDILKSVEAWWLKNDTAPDRDACLAYAKSL